MRTDQIATVVGLLREVLPDAVLGIYLHGSAVFGSLKPTSDLDLFVVTSRRTTDRERRELIERLLPISGPGDPTGRSRSVEFEIVAQGDLRPWRYPVWLDFQFGDWYRPEFAKSNDAPWDYANPDLAIVLAMVLQADRPQFGPPPSELFGPIPWADVRRAMVEGIPDLLSYLDGDERNVVLTFARIWTTLATGEFRSKDGAADWAIPLLPEEHRAVLERARELYVRGIPTEDWGDLMPRVRPHVDYVVAEIARLGASPAVPE
jgi:predicted nucleotidyltransferase